MLKLKRMCQNLEHRESNHPMNRPSHAFLPIVLLIPIFWLSACGGGGGGGGTPTATIKGTVTDGAFPNTAVTLTSGSPTGPTVGTATTDSNGNYSFSFTPPSGSLPLFISATYKSNTLSSYIGGSNSYSTGTTYTSSNLPNLVVNEVTTGTLAILQNQGVSLSSLTPTTYGQQVNNLQNLIVQAAAIVQDIVDGTDSGASLPNGDALTASNLSSALGTISTTTNLISVAQKFPSVTSSSLNALITKIDSNPALASQLTSASATPSTTQSVSTGTYTGTVYPTMSYNGGCSGDGPPGSFTGTFTIGNGTISFSSSSDGSASGTLTGNTFTMSGSTGSGNKLSISGSLTSLQNGSVSGGSGFLINGTWQATCSGGTYGGTYIVPALLTNGASLTSSASSIPNGTYSGTASVVCVYQSQSNGCNNSAPPDPYTVSPTITINGNNISYTLTDGSSGSGTFAGNTFQMTSTNINGCSGDTSYLTGVLSYSGGQLIGNGSSYQQGSSCGYVYNTFTFALP